MECEADGCDLDVASRVLDVVSSGLAGLEWIEDEAEEDFGE